MDSTIVNETADPVRVGVVGCGNQGLALATAVLRSPELRLVAGADPDATARAAFDALAPGNAVYDSIEQLLQGTEVDAVLVATPHHLLAPLALTAIRAGKHVLVEKPMALTGDEAREVEFAAASAGLVCLIGYSFRFGMAKALHEAYAAGLVGELTAITGSICLPRLDDGWIADPACGGGPLLFVGCHLVDLVLWVYGEEPTHVSAMISRRERTGVDDTTALQLGFSGGRPAQLLFTQSAGDFDYDLRVIGRSGSIRLHGTDFVHYEVVVQSTRDDAYARPTVVAPTSEGDPIDTMFVPELAEFAAAMSAPRLPSITASDGRRVLRVLDAAVESARTGRAVALGAPLLAAY